MSAENSTPLITYFQVTLAICRTGLDIDVHLQVLCEWLEGQMEAGKTTARFLPLYFLLRGRITEGLHAHARLVRSPMPGEPPVSATPSYAGIEVCDDTSDPLICHASIV